MSIPYYYKSLDKGNLIIENKENENILYDILEKIKTDEPLNICFLSSGNCRSEIYIIEYLILNRYKINKLIFFDLIYSDKKIVDKIIYIIELINNFYNQDIKYSFNTNYETVLLDEFNNFLNNYPNINKNDYKIDLVIGIHYQIVIMGETIDIAKEIKKKYVNDLIYLKERIDYMNFYCDDLISKKILQYFNYNDLIIKYTDFPISDKELEVKKREIK